MPSEKRNAPIDQDMPLIRLDTTTSDDFLLWGLLSGYGGHKICWEINKVIKLHMVRQEDICLERRPEANNAYFSFYQFDDEANGLVYDLIGNKSNGEFYMRELKNFDFLLMVRGELDFMEVQPFTQSLKRLPSVQSVMEIDLAKLKQLSHLILE